MRTVTRMKRKPRRIIVASLLVVSSSTSNSPGQATNSTQAGDAVRAKLPEIVVTENQTESRPGWQQEEQPVGENEQPEWTTRRRFSTTRVYVLPPWQFEFEQWWKGKFPRHGGPE